MKEGWEYSTIGDLCDKMNGLWKGKIGPFVNVGVIRNANFTKAFTLSFDNIEYLDVEEKQYKTRKLVKGDLIVEKSGGSEKQPVGRTVLFDKEEGEYSFSNFTSVLRIKDRNIISPEFLYKYILFVYLRGDTRKMQKATTGIHNIEFDKYLAIPVPTPSPSEQQSIVDYLDSAFAKIDAMKANAEKALNEAKALFQASLKDMLEPKEGWVTSTLKDECFKITDGTHQTPKYFPSGYIFLSSKNVTSRKIDWEDVKFIDEDQHQLMHKRVAPQIGDILLAKNGTTGVAAMVDQDVVFDIYVSLALLRSKGNITPEYLLTFVNSPIAKEQFDKRLIGMGVPNLHLGEIKQVVITYPKDKGEQAKITQRIEELDNLIISLQANYEKISQECDALKQAILRQVFE